MSAFSIRCLIYGKCFGTVWTGLTHWITPIDSSPAVANGVVYVGSSISHEFAFSTNPSAAGVSCTTDSNGKVFCDPLWSGSTGGSVESSPAIADGVVYTGSNDGNLYSFDLNSVAARAFQPPPRPALSKLHPDLRLTIPA